MTMTTTTMTTQATQRSTWEWLAVAAQLCVAALGAFYSYGFGMRISGLPLAVLLAANGAFFGAIMVGYLADVLALARRRRVPGSLPD